MRKISYISILVLAALLASMMTTSLAQEPTISTGFQIQNFSTTAPANVVLTYYDSTDGAVESEVSNISIPMNGSMNFASIPDDHNLADGFAGSLVVSSDQPVASVVNLIASGSFNGGASYNSASEGAEVVSFPIVFNGFFTRFNTFLYVQNVGTSNATVEITYVARVGSVDTTQNCLLTTTISPGATVKLDQANNPCLVKESDALGFFGAATVRSTNGVPIAGVLVQYDDNSIQANNGLTASDSSTETLIAPLFISNIFYTWSSMNVQNTGDTTTTVGVTFTPSGTVGSECTQMKEIGPLASVAFGNAEIQQDDACVDGTYNENNNTRSFVGSARVTENSAGQPLVALVNQADLRSLVDESTDTALSQLPPVEEANASTYNAFTPNSGASTLQMPIIIKNVDFPGISRLDTGISIANVGQVEAEVTCSFSGRVNQVETDVSEHSRTVTVPVGGSRNITQNHVDSTLPDIFVGSATCSSSTEGASLIGVVNQIGNRGDLITTYEAIPQ